MLGEASDLASALGNVERREPPVLVLDLDRPDGSTIETIRWLRTQVPRTEIVMPAMEESTLVAQQTLAAGAVAFVLNDRAEAKLREAIHHAASGREFVSTRVSAEVEVPRRADDGGPLGPRKSRSSV